MKIQNLLCEKGNADYTVLSNTNLQQTVQKYAPGALSRLSKSSVMIYRGVRNAPGDIFIQNTLTTTRASQNTYNYVTMLTSVVPSWTSRNLPPRSKGISCTTSRYMAKDYGDVYIVVPFNDALLAYSGSDDFWTSLPNIRRPNPKIQDVQDLNDAIHDILNTLQVHQAYPKGAERNVDELAKAFKLVEELIASDKPSDLATELLDNELIAAYDASSFSSIMEMLDHMLDPIHTRLTSGDNLLTTASEEVFVSGQVLFIAEYLWKTL